MSPQHRYLADLTAEIEIPKDGITSRALYNDDSTRVVIFGFDAGQELSEHTASMPAIIHILKGEATLQLGDETHEAGEGAWAFMEANLSHSLVAKSPVVMLLTLNKAAKAKA